MVTSVRGGRWVGELADDGVGAQLMVTQLLLEDGAQVLIFVGNRSHIASDGEILEP